MNRQTHGADDGTRTRKGVATLWVLKTHVYTFSTTSASGKINSSFGLSFRPTYGGLRLPIQQSVRLLVVILSRLSPDGICDGTRTHTHEAQAPQACLSTISNTQT